MSNDVWTYREATVVATEIDVSGYDVEATDGSIGKVDEATYETGRSYLVVDTGPWILGHKVVLPAGLVGRVDRENETVHVTCTKEHVRESPDFESGQNEDDVAFIRLIEQYYANRHM